MAKKLNITMLKEDLHNIAYKGLCELHTNIKKLDYETIVGKVLKKWGWSYSLNSLSGDFAITVAPGFYVRAELRNGLYDVSMDINYNGLSASSIDTCSGILFTPYDIECCKPVFDKLVAGLQAEYAKCEVMNKGTKGAMLLKSMMTPVFRKNKLSGITVERYDDDATTFLIKKNVFGNAFLGTKISFETYENGINRMVEAFKNLPNWVKNLDRLKILTKDLNYPRFIGQVACGKGLNLIKDPESSKYSYRRLPDVDTSENDDFSKSEVSVKLNELGYVFYGESDGVYNIFLNKFLNKNILLCRNNNAVWLKQHLGQPLSETYLIDDTEFYILLKILTWGCPADWNAWDFKTLPRLMAESFKKVLPTSVDEFYIFDEGFAIHYKDCWYIIDIKNPKWLSLTENVINYMRADKEILDYLKFPNLELIIKE